MSEIIRGSLSGKEKYCRIPIRRKSTLEQVANAFESGDLELSARKILEMPHDDAAMIIDAIIEDWLYWLDRANELFVLRQGEKKRAVSGVTAQGNSGDGTMAY